jgi:hypothetical protein
LAPRRVRTCAAPSPPSYSCSHPGRLRIQCLVHSRPVHLVGGVPSSVGPHRSGRSRASRKKDSISNSSKPPRRHGAPKSIALDMVRPFWAQAHARSVVEPQPSSWFSFCGTFCPSRRQIRGGDPFHPVLADSPAGMLHSMLAGMVDRSAPSFRA